jgi:hypothetical protein
MQGEARPYKSRAASPAMKAPRLATFWVLAPETWIGDVLAGEGTWTVLALAGEDAGVGITALLSVAAGARTTVLLSAGTTVWAGTTTLLSATVTAGMV